MSNALLSGVPVTVRNLGGIDGAELSLHHGVNVFFGENASNRSSLFSAIAGALGARVPTPKTDTQSSLVRLEHGDAEYVVDIDRSDGTRQVTAHTLTARTALCDHFVRLLEDNPLRQSVERMDEAELYELLMEPVDTAEIESQIDRAKTERERVDKQLSHYDDLQSRLPSLRTSREQLREELDEVAAEIDSVQAELEDRSQSTPRADDQQFSELESKRDRYRELTATLRTQQEALDSLESERQAVEEELADHTDGHDVESVDDIDARIDDRRGRKRQLTNTIQLLQTVIEAGRKTTQQSTDLFDAAADGSRASSTDQESETDHGHVTDTLTQSTEAMSCLTCGSTVTPEDIEGQITELQSIIADKRDEQQALDEEIASLEATRDRIQTERDRIDRLHRRAEQLDTEIDETEATIESLQADRADLDVEIDALEAAVAQHEHDADSAQRELQDRLTDLEVDRGRIEGRFEDVTAEITEIESAVANRDELEARRDKLTSRLEALRNRIYDIERETVDTINTVMDEVITELAFENISRVWVERHVQTDNQKARADGFDLHIVRTTDEGAAYEDTVGTLSTSEREVIGIVLGVAGYIVHDVHETVPFLLLDAIESIDAERTASLLSYLSEYADYLLATAHPEDRGAFPSSVRSLEISDALD